MWENDRNNLLDEEPAKTENFLRVIEGVDRGVVTVTFIVKIDKHIWLHIQI